jgi:hypothetical protein
MYALRLNDCGWLERRLPEHPVLHLENLSRVRVDEHGIRIVAYPLIAGRRYFQCEQPIVREYVGCGPKSAGEDLAETPVMGDPAGRTVVRADSEAARGLKIMLIRRAVDRGGTGVPAMRFGDALVPVRALMRFSVRGLRMRVAATAVLMRGLTDGYTTRQNHCEGRTDT